ncbi:MULTISPECIES: Mor transcription activator family protein [Pasteurellaceae]|uniref:Mor transcription activator family protein n=1 Tax=Pasteurella atlantica TaxID=2827233 RepID=A0AAW8CSD4_9PAST|nr:Mor transcription activator family protein [Pasteurella atlantica]MBR0573700.1 transcriptional regulator [Pasteurella atlantica]MDP8039665.1 Mor transcription activator family protein [Pasteurella atlantica]MDP8041756.1 Mor transcription activator family protein [Pasteurella atlantica]MDP8043970.1 Mor transcription activator family protein [Pasteurella atlantica]MDP8045948.1 Mor transcription activator family protein [Pasteurella atlantica]
MIEKDVFTKKTPDVLIGLAQVVETVAVQSLDLSKENAEQLGIDIAQAMAKEWGGSMLYIPINLVFNLSQRDLEIWEKFNGFNHAELAREFGISKQWVYHIIKRIRKQMQDKAQPDLFNNGNQ